MRVNETASTDSRRGEPYGAYLDYHGHLTDAKLKAHAQLDSFLLKFSSGALALSLSPTTRLFETSDTAPKGLLVLAWALYLVTIGATLWSFRASAKSCDKMVDIAYEVIVEEDKGAGKRHKEASKSTQRLNFLSIWSFLAALLFSLVYLAMTFLA
jgi:hypothetical protein